MADALNVSDLDHLWDPAAPPLFTAKPREWVATYLPRYCQSVSDRTDSDCRGLAQVVRELHRDGFWQQLFPDWETCCQALFKRPAAWVEQVVEGVRVLHAQGHRGEIPLAVAAAAAEAQPLAEHGTNQHGGEDFTLSNPPTGNSQAYLLRRLARDAPEILERVKAGEFRSARAAAIEAGIIRPVPTVRLVDDPAKVAASIRQHLSPDDVIRLVEALMT
jgi:hypothetical protein